MSYIGKTPTPAPLTSSDITDGIISTSKLADTSVTNAKINADIISAETELATAPADTDELLISDAGVLKRIDASLIGGGGITNAQQWRITTSFTGNADPITANWEEADTYGYGRLGTTMASSSGVFTFPTTGFWYISSTMTHIEGSSELQYGVNKIKATTNNSSYNDIAVSYNSVKVDGGYQTTTANAVMDITDTSTHKISIGSTSNHSSTSTMGDSNLNRTYVTFIRLGDT